MKRLRVLTGILGMVQGLDRSRIDHRICLLYAEHPDIEARFGTTVRCSRISADCLSESSQS